MVISFFLAMVLRVSMMTINNYIKQVYNYNYIKQKVLQLRPCDFKVLK